jgi:hypothetical protein
MPDVQNTRDPKLDPTHIEYWIAEAHKLKHAADLCWEADLSLIHDTENARRFGVDQVLIEAADDAEVELNWLYPNLITFAVQHLAIGILLNRNPQRIIDQGARFQISNAVQECGISLDTALSDVLTNVENAFRWGEKSPHWNVRLSADQIHTLKRQKPYMLDISEQQKQALDELFAQLDAVATAEANAKDNSKDNSKDKAKTSSSSAADSQ